MATKAEKAAKVEELTAAINEAPLSIVAGYTGLKVSDMQALRRQMREAGATFRVVKNSLAILAARAGNAGGLEPHFHGQAALTFSGEDIVAAARALRNFSAGYPSMEIRAGVAAGDVVDGDRVIRIAMLPGIDQLRAEFVWSIESPISGLVHTLEGVIQGLVYALQGCLDQMQTDAEGA